MKESYAVSPHWTLRFITVAAAWIVAYVMFSQSVPLPSPLLFFFPIGLMYWFGSDFRSDSPVFPICVIIWICYGLLSSFVIGQTRRRPYLLLFGALLAILALNVAGCEFAISKVG